FRCFSSPERLSDPKDIKWLESEYGPRVDRLITVAYLALTRINRRLNEVSKYKSARWCPLENIGKMPFDHNRIVDESLGEIREWVTTDPAIMFELLPPKFTEAELRHLYEAIHGRKYDVRNFHKKWWRWITSWLWMKNRRGSRTVRPVTINSTGCSIKTVCTLPELKPEKVVCIFLVTI
ncbi:MAG: hypothetical protein LUE10_08900, partial [Alistipes sp.]|nr:hypothetical protein [Alistipes sp.]